MKNSIVHSAKDRESIIKDTEAIGIEGLNVSKLFVDMSLKNFY